MRVACLATNDFEDSELASPKEALEEAGHDVMVIAPTRDDITGKLGKVTVRPDFTIDDVSADDFDALFIPGGYSPDKLRADARFVDFVRDYDALDRPILAICHGPQLLLTADTLAGRRVTAWKTVQDDLRRAGIHVVDRPVVVDDQVVTSRNPGDIPAFNQAIIELLAEVAQRTIRRGAGESRAPLH